MGTSLSANARGSPLVPILLAPVLGSLGISGAIAGPLSSILFTGLSLLLSILFAPKVPKPEDGRNPFKQPVPNRIRIIGRRRTGGAYMLFHSYASQTFYGVVALCDGEVGSFTAYWLHDDSVDLSGDGHTVLGLGIDGPNRYGNEKVRIYTRFGLPSEVSFADTVLDVHNRLELDDNVWTTDHRGDGIASLLLVAADAGKDDQAARFPFGLPQPSAEVIATRVFDPRTPGGEGSGSVGSGISGRSSGGATVGWSFAGNDNPILQAMWYLTAPIAQGGLGLDFTESFSTVLSDVSAQADICDEVVAKKSGSEKRYISGALFKYSDDPADVLAAIMGSCDGFVAERGDGAFELKAGKWDDDDFAIVIKDRHIISLHVTRFRPDEDEVTGVIVKYNSLVHGHQTVDAPVWPRDAYQGGEDRRVRTIEINYCPSGTQAQRLSKRVATYEMAPVRGTMVLNMYGILLLDRRGCTIQCTDDPALNDCKARLTRLETNLIERTVTVDFTVFDPVACDEWDAASEEGPLQPVVTVPLTDVNTIPANLSPVASKLRGSLYVDLSFDPGSKSGPNESFIVRWRLSDIGDGIPGGWTQVNFSPSQVEKPADDLWIVTINPVPADQLEFQMRGGLSQYSASAFVDATMPAPGRPTGFSGALVGSDVVLNWTNPNSTIYDHSRVYRGLHGAGFGLASDISGPISSPPGVNAANTYTDVAPASGNYDYWVSAENSSNIASTPTGPVNVTVP
jgi:hypothetical protein